jgi:hypothetical protein
MKSRACGGAGFGAGRETIGFVFSNMLEFRAPWPACVRVVTLIRR